MADPGMDELDRESIRQVRENDQPRSNSDLVGEAKRLSEAATPGPWLIRDSEVWWLSSEATGEQVVEMLCEETNEQGCRDAEFIARARTLLPELAQQLEQARYALNWYDVHKRDDGSYDGEVFGDLSALTPDEGADPGVR